MTSIVYFHSVLIKLEVDDLEFRPLVLSLFHCPSLWSLQAREPTSKNVNFTLFFKLKFVTVIALETIS